MYLVMIVKHGEVKDEEHFDIINDDKEITFDYCQDKAKEYGIEWHTIGKRIESFGHYTFRDYYSEVTGYVNCFNVTYDNIKYIIGRIEEK